MVLLHNACTCTSSTFAQFRLVFRFLSASFLLYSLGVACYAFKDKTDNMLNNQTMSAQATADLGLRLGAFNEKKPRKCIAFGALLLVCPWGKVSYPRGLECSWGLQGGENPVVHVAANTEECNT